MKNMAHGAMLILHNDSPWRAKFGPFSLALAGHALEHRGPFLARGPRFGNRCARECIKHILGSVSSTRRECIKHTVGSVSSIP